MKPKKSLWEILVEELGLWIGTIVTFIIFIIVTAIAKEIFKEYPFLIVIILVAIIIQKSVILIIKEVKQEQDSIWKIVLIPLMIVVISIFSIIGIGMIYELLKAMPFIATILIVAIIRKCYFVPEKIQKEAKEKEYTHTEVKKPHKNDNIVRNKQKSKTESQSIKIPNLGNPDDFIVGIYCIVNTINNKIYIGESIDIKKRWQKHFHDLSNNNHHNYKLQIDFKKYGEGAFFFNVLKRLRYTVYEDTKRRLLLAEEEQILYEKSIGKELYNLENHEYKNDERDLSYFLTTNLITNNNKHVLKDEKYDENNYNNYEKMEKLPTFIKTEKHTINNKHVLEDEKNIGCNNKEYKTISSINDIDNIYEKKIKNDLVPNKDNTSGYIKFLKKIFWIILWLQISGILIFILYHIFLVE